MNRACKKQNFLLIEILLAMALFFAVIPLVVKQFSYQKLYLEERIIDLQIKKIRDESLFSVEQHIKFLLTQDESKIHNYQSELLLCSQKLFSFKGKVVDVFYSYGIKKIKEHMKRERKQKGVLIDIDMTLFLPKKKELQLERSIFFSYETK